jgi:hypothetical protein
MRLDTMSRVMRDDSATASTAANAPPGKALLYPAARMSKSLKFISPLPL